MLKHNFERSFNINRNVTEKINSISEKLTKIKGSFDFYLVCDSHIGNLVCPCAHVCQKRTWGALIGAGALNRANTIYVVMLVVDMMHFP